jgi:hypothetical protein
VKFDFVEREAIAMAKTSAGKPAVRGGKPAAGSLRKGSASRTKLVHRDVKSGQFVVSKTRFEAVMSAAEQSGLLSGKSARIGGMVSLALVKQA